MSRIEIKQQNELSPVASRMIALFQRLEQRNPDLASAMCDGLAAADLEVTGCPLDGDGSEIR